MIKVSTKRRKTTQEDIPESIFDALNAHDPSAGKNTDTKKAAAATGNEPSVADLMKQLSDMNSRVERAEQANLALTAAPQPNVADTPVAPKFDLTGLPDPLDDKDGYARALAERTASYTQAVGEYQAKINQPAQTQGNADQLWQDFEENYGDYASDKDGVEFAVGLATKKAKARGLDLNKYMYQNSDRFFRDVTAAYDKRFGKPDADDDDDNAVELEPTPRRKRKAAAEADDGDDGRSQGIFGGIDGGSGATPKVQVQKGDMIKDLQDIQRKTGYF